MSKQKVFICDNYISVLVSLSVFKQAKRIFIFCTKSFNNEISKLKNLHQMNCTIFIFSDFTPNPRLDNILKGILIFKEFNPDLVIAVGGGSCIDFAKIINFLSVQKDEYIDIIRKNINELTIPTKLIAIPTTAGSGSESTKFATFYINYLKYSLEHQFILPSYVILDCNLTLSMDSYLTAVSGMDALSQAIESYWSVNSNRQSKIYATKAMKLILSNLVNSVRTSSIDSRSNMLIAANLAGRAINITKTTAPHAFSYSLTSHFGVPHGHAVAIFLPIFFVINSNWKDFELNAMMNKRTIKNSIKHLCRIMGCQNAIEASLKIKILMRQINLCDNLKELNIDITELKDIIKLEVNHERLANNPVVISQQIIDDIFNYKY